jgi:hypothetical protein
MKLNQRKVKRKMTEEVKNPLSDKVVVLQYTIESINDMINMMNKPLTTPVMAWANLIINIQDQCAPQIDAFNQELREKNEQPTK